MNWKGLIGAIAPTLATALGGPLAGIATKQISEKVLGIPQATEKELEAAIVGGDPETLAKLKELDQEFKVKMEELGIDLEKVQAADRASARAREIAVRDWVPSVLAIANMVAFVAVLALMLYFPIPERNSQVFNILLGILGGNLVSVMTYYYGSSSGSKQKDQIIGKKLNGG